MTRRVFRTLLALLSLAGTAAATPTPVDPLVAAAGIGQKVEPFTAELITLSGGEQKSSPFDSRKVDKPTAYVIVGAGCPTTAAYVERFKQLEETYAARGVQFVYVYPNREDTTDAKIGFHKTRGLSGGLIDDQGGRVARLLRAQRTSEYLLVDKQGTILYRGAVDDSRDPKAVKNRYVATALDEHLAGKPITTPASQVFA